MLRPWLVLLVEPLHGLTFAGVWTATVEYARRLARPGMEAKMQALISGRWIASRLRGCSKGFSGTAAAKECCG